MYFQTLLHKVKNQQFLTPREMRTIRQEEKQVEEREDNILEQTMNKKKERDNVKLPGNVGMIEAVTVNKVYKYLPVVSWNKKSYYLLAHIGDKILPGTDKKYVCFTKYEFLDIDTHEVVYSKEGFFPSVSGKLGSYGALKKEIICTSPNQKWSGIFGEIFHNLHFIFFSVNEKGKLFLHFIPFCDFSQEKTIQLEDSVLFENISNNQFISNEMPQLFSIMYSPPIDDTPYYPYNLFPNSPLELNTPLSYAYGGNIALCFSQQKNTNTVILKNNTIFNLKDIGETYQTYLEKNQWTTPISPLNKVFSKNIYAYNRLEDIYCKSEFDIHNQEGNRTYLSEFIYTKDNKFISVADIFPKLKILLGKIGLSNKHFHENEEAYKTMKLVNIGRFFPTKQNKMCELFAVSIPLKMAREENNHCFFKMFYVDKGEVFFVGDDNFFIWNQFHYHLRNDDAVFDLPFSTLMLGSILKVKDRESISIETKICVLNQDLHIASSTKRNFIFEDKLIYQKEFDSWIVENFNNTQIKQILLRLQGFKFNYNKKNKIGDILISSYNEEGIYLLTIEKGKHLLSETKIAPQEITNSTSQPIEQYSFNHINYKNTLGIAKVVRIIHFEKNSQEGIDNKEYLSGGIYGNTSIIFPKQIEIGFTKDNILVYKNVNSCFEKNGSSFKFQPFDIYKDHLGNIGASRPLAMNYMIYNSNLILIKPDSIDKNRLMTESFSQKNKIYNLLTDSSRLDIIQGKSVVLFRDKLVVKGDGMIGFLLNEDHFGLQYGGENTYLNSFKLREMFSKNKKNKLIPYYNIGHFLTSSFVPLKQISKEKFLLSNHNNKSLLFFHYKQPQGSY